jgi:hypothetical protein
MGYGESFADQPRGPIGRIGSSLARSLGFEDDGPQLMLLLSCLFVVPTLAWLVSAGFAVGEEATLVTEMVIGG